MDTVVPAVPIREECLALLEFGRGLLACDSSYSARPSRPFGQWPFGPFVLAHSGGTAADLHRLPCSRLPIQLSGITIPQFGRTSSPISERRGAEPTAAPAAATGYPLPLAVAFPLIPYPFSLSLFLT